MCLDELADFEVKKNYAWQYFDPKKHPGHLSELMSDKIVRTDEWVKDGCPTTLSCSKEAKEYKTGFHQFLYKPYGKPFSSENSFIYATDVLRKVYFKNVVAKGYLKAASNIPRYKIIVTRERYVCDKTKRPPKE